MKLGSLFDGIGGWLIAASRAGITPVWSSEIEKFPRAVTAYHFPDVKQLGDITKIDGAAIEPVDIITLGSPCQDLSVAGKRAGLAGERSGLFVRAVELIRQMRNATNGKYPRYAVWENVPGAYTSNKGMDFKAVLEAFTEAEIPMPKDGRWANAGMVQCPKCEIAWRVLDAQYWGVPQRRKRIFLVADFAAADRRAGKILFIEPSLSGNTEQSRETRKRVASTIEKSIRTASELVHRGGTFDIRISSDGTHNWRAHCYETDKSRSLDTHAPDPNTNHGGVAIVCKPKEVEYAITAKHYKNRNAALRDRERINAMREKTVGALLRRDYKGIGNQDLPKCDKLIIEKKYTVRRLTPLECERLQGLPDGWTLINDKSCSDSARYKAIGNGMAQPCADFVLRRIVLHETR